MNYNEHIANDLLDTHKIRTLKTDENNKENAQATGKYLANVSISSLGAGILSETQLNMSNNGLLSSASFFNLNESDENTDENEIINTMSMRHINDELNNATKTAESFIGANIFLESSRREDQDTSVDTNLLKQEIEQLKQKIDEKVAQV